MAVVDSSISFGFSRRLLTEYPKKEFIEISSRGFLRRREFCSIIGIGRPNLSQPIFPKARKLHGRFLRSSPLSITCFAMLVAACGPTSQDSPANGPSVTPTRYVTSPSGADVASGVFVKGVRLGGLSISPMPSGSAKDHLELTWSQAAKLFRSSTSEEGAHLNAILGFGLVSLSGSKQALGGLKVDHLPAWVGIAWGEITSCPAMRTSKESNVLKAAAKPIYSAVVIYGRGGKGAFSYDSRGQLPCGGAISGPIIRPAREVRSVPWILKSIDGAGVVQVGLSTSSCGQLFSESASGNLKTGKFTLSVDESLPFDPKGCSLAVSRLISISLLPPSRVTNTFFPSGGIVVDHGPIGAASVLQVSKVLGGGS